MTDFHALTGRDFGRSIAWSKSAPNLVLQKIHNLAPMSKTAEKPAETQLAKVDDRRASMIVAGLAGLSIDMLLDTVRVQCFKGANATDFQVAAFVSIAAEMKVNPLLPGMLYAYPIQGGGVIPIMGPDGVFKKLAEHSDVDSWEVQVFPEDPTVPPTHAKAFIYLKGKERPLTYTAALNEWKINSNPNWTSRPRHMLQLRAIKHVARQIIHGIPYDEDERVIMGEINVTPGAESPAGDPGAGQRPPPPLREKKGAAKVQEAAQKPIDITATPAGATPPAAAPAPEPPPAEAPLAPVTRITLNDAERATFAVEVVEVIPSMLNGKPGVKAKVKGQFEGTVYDTSGATAAGDVITPSAAWKVGNQISIELLGKKNATGTAVFCMVQKVSQLEEVPS